MQDGQYTEGLSRVVNSKRWYLKPMRVREGLVNSLDSYERRADLPPSLLAEYDQCLASGLHLLSRAMAAGDNIVLPTTGRDEFYTKGIIRDLSSTVVSKAETGNIPASVTVPSVAGTQ